MMAIPREYRMKTPIVALSEPDRTHRSVIPEQFRIEASSTRLDTARLYVGRVIRNIVDKQETGSPLPALVLHVICIGLRRTGGSGTVWEATVLKGPFHGSEPHLPRLQRNDVASSGSCRRHSAVST